MRVNQRNLVKKGTFRWFTHIPSLREALKVCKRFFPIGFRSGRVCSRGDVVVRGANLSSFEEEGATPCFLDEAPQPHKSKQIRDGQQP